MKLKGLLLIFFLILLVYFVVLLFPQESHKISQGLAIPSLSVLAGMLIAAVGVFLGSLGNLYNLIQQKETIKFKALSSFFNLIKKTVQEIKHNVLFTIIALIIVIFLPVFKNSNIPLLKWPLDLNWFTKDIFFTWIILSLIILVFQAVVDSISAMFLLHKHFEIIIKDSLIEREHKEDETK